MFERFGVLLLLSACGAAKPAGDAGVGVSDAGMIRVQGATGSHLSSCDDPACGGGSAFAVGGDHCGSTLSCRKYDVPQKKCSWLHNLEHGHAVLLYNCPNGCQAEVEQAERLRTAKGRRLMAPDPSLPAKFFVAVWGFGWKGDALDTVAAEYVLAQQDKEAPEPNLGCAP